MYETMEADNEGFSIREYTRNMRSVDMRKCWPFSGDVIQSLLPPLTVAKFRWWSHELASLLTKSPVRPDDSKPAFRRKDKAKSRPCKKRSISEILTASPQIQLPCGEVLKRKKTKDLVSQKKVNDSTKPVRQDCGSELQIHGILKAKRKVCSTRRSLDKSDVGASQCERQVRFYDQSGELSQLFSLQLCCSQMSRLSLCSTEDQLHDKKPKVISNDDQTSDKMMLESRQLNEFQPVVSERRLSHARAKSGLSCVPTPHLSLERITDALDLERKGHVAQPIQSVISTSSDSHYTSCSASSSQPASADTHCGTLLNQSPFDPLLVEWMQKSVLHRQRHVEEANGEGRTSFDRSGLGTGSSRSASAENDILLSNVVDLSSEKKHSTEAAFDKDMHNEKRHKYFPARLGLDETFTENAFFVSDTNDGECGQTVHSPASEVNRGSHTINLPEQDALNQNLSGRNMVGNRDGLCLHNNQSTMWLMGKNVSVGTSYSDMVGRGERIIAPDASIDYSFTSCYTHQSCWLWRSPTLGSSDNHSITSLDKNWNRSLLCDTSKDPFPMFCEPHVGLAPQARTAVVPDSYFPRTILYPCGSLVSFPLTDKDLSFNGSGLGQQLNSVTFSQQQLPFLSYPEIAGLPSDYSNVSVGLLPDAREPSFGLPFSCTDSTSQSQAHWLQSSFESSRLDMSFINPVEQQASLYGSKSSSYINVAKLNRRVASVEEYAMKNQKISKFPMQRGVHY